MRFFLPDESLWRYTVTLALSAEAVKWENGGRREMAALFLALQSSNLIDRAANQSQSESCQRSHVGWRLFVSNAVYVRVQNFSDKGPFDLNKVNILHLDPR